MWSWGPRQRQQQATRGTEQNGSGWQPTDDELSYPLYPALYNESQRVSHHWHALIQQSEKLQIALFFKPNKKKHRWGSRKRILNPLIKANLWPGFFLKELHTRPRWQYCIEKEYFTLINPQKEHAYLRQEASWRRMLMYQPPTSHVAIIELETTRPSPEYTQIFLQPKDGDFLRLGNLNTGINYCGMAPCQDPLLFWYQGGHMKRNKRQYQGERKFSVSKLLVDCDAVIFCKLPKPIQRNWTYMYEVLHCLDSWLDSVGRFTRVSSRYHKPIWND
ncbi:hypothetical protein MW887_006948 [Aspergillus wentii]|nr:hypothetical protein MW887_006948 [Aspergillus wentii]